jgi:hypothetical protein
MPLGVLGMLGLMILVEQYVWTQNDDYTTAQAAQYRLAGSDASGAALGCEVLFFGDSQMKMGVSPQVIAARAGRRAYNLALVGSPPPVAYFLLRRALDAGARPNAVFINTKANIISTDLNWHLRNLPEALSPRDAFELSRSTKDYSLFARISVAGVLASYRSRDDIRASVVAALGGGSASNRSTVVAFRRNWRVNRGAMINAERHWTGLSDNEKAVFAPDKWTVDPLNASYIRKFFRLAASRRIKAYWLIPPIAPELQAMREARGLDAQFSRWVNSVRERHSNVVVLDARRSEFSHEVFSDTGHLDYRGASALSAGIADEIRDAPRDGSWIHLAKYRPVSMSLENVEQSKQVVLRTIAGERR